MNKRKYNALNQSQDAGKKEIEIEDSKPGDQIAERTDCKKESVEKRIAISRSGFEELEKKAGKLAFLSIKVQHLIDNLEYNGEIDV